jgi:hypothetical protein
MLFFSVFANQNPPLSTCRTSAAPRPPRSLHNNEKLVPATPLCLYSCALFHSPYPVTPLFATLTEMAGVSINKSRCGACSPVTILAFLRPSTPKTQNPPLYFQSLAHSSAIKGGWGVECPFSRKTRASRRPLFPATPPLPPRQRIMCPQLQESTR